MKYIDAEKLMAEIERYEETAIDAYNPLGEDADLWHGKVTACEDIKTIIASLQQEQPALPCIEDPGIPGKDFIPVEWVDACEMYGKWKIVKQEQPEVDLEKLLNLELPDMTIDEDLGLCTCNQFGNQSMAVSDIKEIARHFYELGLNARKEEKK